MVPAPSPSSIPFPLRRNARPNSNKLQVGVGVGAVCGANRVNGAVGAGGIGVRLSDGHSAPSGFPIPSPLKLEPRRASSQGRARARKITWTHPDHHQSSRSSASSSSSSEIRGASGDLGGSHDQHPFFVSSASGDTHPSLPSHPSQPSCRGGVGSKSQFSMSALYGDGSYRHYATAISAPK